MRNLILSSGAGMTAEKLKIVLSVSVRSNFLVNHLSLLFVTTNFKLL